MAIESGMRLLEYLRMVTKQPITLDGEYYCGAVQSVEIKDSFFWKDDCAMCGRCCINETNAWTEEGYQRILAGREEDFTIWGLPFEKKAELLEVITKVVHDVNGKEVTIYTCPKISEKLAPRVAWEDRPERTRCRWLFEKEGTYRCSIHPIRSVTCGMPHCRFYNSRTSGRTTMGISQYGRNWALKCPVVFSHEVDEEGVQSRILWLTRLKAVADDFGVETFLPEILEYLNAGNRSPIVFEAQHKRKLFTVR